MSHTPKQCPSCGGFKEQGHTCPILLSPATVTIEGRSYIVPGEVACVFQAVSEERDEAKIRIDVLEVALALSRKPLQLDKVMKLETALSEIREVWAGSDGFIPETVSEGYLQRICQQQYEIACEGLK